MEADPLWSEPSTRPGKLECIGPLNTSGLMMPTLSPLYLVTQIKYAMEGTY